MKTRLSLALISILVVAGRSSVAQDAVAQDADVVYHGGSIVTVDDDHPTAEAVAIRDGKILVVGSREEASRVTGDSTRTIDLNGKTMLPGFVDAHGHVMAGGLQALSANLLAPPDGEVQDIASMQETLRDWMAENQEAVDRIKLVVGFGYDNAQLLELRHPTRDDLDAVSTELPIVLAHQSGHIIAVNSMALELGGITAQTANPAGGVIRRRDDGKEPNGVLEETAAFPLLMRLLARVGAEGAAQFTRAGAELWASFGYTTAQDGRTMPSGVKTLKAVAAAGELEIDIVSYPDVLVARDLIKQEVSSTYKNRFRVAGAKLTIDGSPQGFTAWRDRPYYRPVGDYPPGYAGYAAATPEQVGDAIQWAFANQIQILTHSNGEAASDQLVAFIEAATEKHGAGDRRPVLVHGQFLRKDQIDSLNRLGVIPSLFPMHTFYWGDWHREHTVGPLLADNISPTGWCVQRGMRFTSHHDAPVAFPNSMRVLDATVTRRSRSGDIIGPGQRVDVMTAIKSMTIWPAWQHFEENEKGSIEVGKLADFVVLDKNPLTIDPEQLDTIRVAQTIKQGVVVYSMPPGESLNANLSAPSLINVLVAMNASGSAIARRGVISSAFGQSRNAPPCTTCVCGALSQIADVIAAGKRQ